jgi:hypothetical protein
MDEFGLGPWILLGFEILTMVLDRGSEDFSWNFLLFLIIFEDS